MSSLSRLSVGSATQGEVELPRRLPQWLSFELADDAKPAYRHLALKLRAAIESGALQPGERLPSERQLALALRVSRTTVQAAYRDLEMLDIVRTRAGAGTYIVDPDSHRSTGRDGLLERLALRRTLALVTPTDLRPSSAALRYDFESEIPSADLLPMSVFRTILNEALSNRSFEAFSSVPPEGAPSLRNLIAHHVLPLRELNGVSEDQIVITRGSAQGLTLLAQLLIGRGDTVLVESPTYPGAIAAFRNAGAHVVGCRTDAGGFDPDALRDAIERHRPKIAYVQTAPRNPDGGGLHPSRRSQIIALLRRARVAVVEDDACGLLSLVGSSRPLKADDASDNVVYLGTFSKVLSPMLRLGYVVAPAHVAHALASLKRSSDPYPSALEQFLLEGWLAIDSLSHHARSRAQEYGARLASVREALWRSSVLEPTVSISNGGPYLFCRVSPPVTARYARDVARRYGVAVACGDEFFAEADAAQYLRLCVAAQDLEALQNGVRRLVHGLQEATGLA